MPGPVSESSHNPSDDSPYVPSWYYKGPRPYICTTCECGENYHNDAGECLKRSKCGCTGYTGIDRELSI
jgi:hypothetical protein